MCSSKKENIFSKILNLFGGSKKCKCKNGECCKNKEKKKGEKIIKRAKKNIIIKKK